MFAKFCQDDESILDTHTFTHCGMKVGTGAGCGLVRGGDGWWGWEVGMGGLGMFFSFSLFVASYCFSSPFYAIRQYLFAICLYFPLFFGI